MEEVITASFVWSKWDYRAAHRGANIALRPDFDSDITRLSALILGLLILSSGLLFIVLVLVEAIPKDRTPPRTIATIGIGCTLVSAYFLFTQWYGRNWFLDRAFRASHLHQEKVEYSFTPSVIQFTSRLSQSKRAWGLIDCVTELRDGFVLASGDVSEWIPRYAFREPFDDVKFSQWVQKLVTTYKFIDRNAAS